MPPLMTNSEPSNSDERDVFHPRVFKLLRCLRVHTPSPDKSPAAPTAGEGHDRSVAVVLPPVRRRQRQNGDCAEHEHKGEHRRQRQRLPDTHRGFGRLARQSQSRQPGDKQKSEGNEFAKKTARAVSNVQYEPSNDASVCRLDDGSRQPPELQNVTAEKRLVKR